MNPEPPVPNVSRDMGETSHLDEHGRPRIVERRFVVDETEAGQRVDQFLKQKIPRLSRTKLQKIIRASVVRGDGSMLKPHSPVVAGQSLILRREAQPEPPCPRDFTVLYEDDYVMVIDKPAGLPMHASARYYFNTLTRVLRERYPDDKRQICHRLDRETSGCVVVAKHREAAARLKGAFEKKRIAKSYLAIVYGVPVFTGAAEPFAIDLPLGLVADPNAMIDLRMEVRADGLPSMTRVRVVEQRAQFALLECIPVTGRQHQIRAHLAALGHPIVGDKLYAHGDATFARCCDSGVTAELLAELLLPRHALHAASIALPHPRDGAILQVQSPLPDDLQQFFSNAP